MPIYLIIDLNKDEPDRLPEIRYDEVMGVACSMSLAVRWTTFRCFCLLDGKYDGLTQHMTEAMTSNRRIVLVTGPAGAGRSSTLNVLEDAGFEAIDNIPMRMLRALIEAPGQLRPMALGVDLRNRDFSTDRVIELMADMRSRPDIDIELLYLDCDTNVLLRRFSETRRRHPMTASATPIEGIVHEKELLEPVLTLADVLIDTSDLNVHQLQIRGRALVRT